MRLISILLSMLIFTLGFMPCADANRLSGGNAQQITSKQEHNHPQKDECSPLCICSCCSVHCSQVPVTAFSFAKQQAEPVYASYLSSPAIRIASSIWQPPRL
jgi:hypothetical protein